MASSVSKDPESCNPKSETMSPCAAESHYLTSDQLFDAVFSVQEEGGDGSAASSSRIQQQDRCEAASVSDSHGDESVVHAVAAVVPDSADAGTSREPMPASHRGPSGPRGPNLNTSPQSLADVSPPGCSITLNCSLLEWFFFRHIPILDVCPISTFTQVTSICLISPALPVQVMTTDSLPNGILDLLKVNKRNPRTLTLQRQPVGDLP